MEGYLGIMSYLARMNVNKEDSTAFFINNLEIIEVFKDEDKKRRQVLWTLSTKYYNYLERSLRS